MAERVSQRQIDREVTACLRAIEPLLGLIGWGSDGPAGGYVTPYEELTPRGVDVARRASESAQASVPRLYDLLYSRAVGTQDTELLGDALGFLMLVSAAIQGLLSEPMLVADEDLAAAWPEIAGRTMDTAVLEGLRRSLSGLLDRVGDVARPTPWGAVSAPVRAEDAEVAVRELLRQVGGAPPPK